ncbi:MULTISPECIES: DUF3305 domain-containing protein [Halomonas]|uniref:DUF3305 domain-containing protein n=1 Tax=Halomonas TaxID=2745 RepID=UPI001CD1BAFA|nr:MULTISPECIES: DUF3305 domain-containing protein [Halomonas]MCA0917909.1 DUF3305 domain-containing protein [Halomonas denitrificans]
MTEMSNRRQLSLDLGHHDRMVKGFRQRNWEITGLEPGNSGPWVLTLVLSMTERAAYRFNLESQTPRLFVRAGHSDLPPKPDAVTASQDVAANWMDGEHRVLATPMPLALQAWVEAYLAAHGEAPTEGRKKKRKGAGRARENTA